MSCQTKVKISDERVANLAAATGISLEDARSRVQKIVEFECQKNNELAVKVVRNANNSQQGYLVAYPGKATILNDPEIKKTGIPTAAALYYDAEKGVGRIENRRGEVITFQVDEEGNISQEKVWQWNTNKQNQPHQVTDLFSEANFQPEPSRHIDADDIHELIRAQIAITRLMGRMKGNNFMKGERKNSPTLNKDFSLLSIVNNFNKKDEQNKIKGLLMPPLIVEKISLYRNQK